jgi:MoaA/NifB/PqqE/SkfB family radical SAM enzyme
VLSGGEPTLTPDAAMSIMTLAKELGYKKIIIQTNGSGLSCNPELCVFLRDFSEHSDVCVSFSVHGPDSGIHDAMSRTPGSFLKLLDAIRIIASTNCGIYTNTVVSRLNIDCLEDIADLILPYRPQVLQFSMMHLSMPSELSTDLLETALAVRRLKNVVPADILRTEGIPYCLMYGMEGCVGESFWPEKLDLYNQNNSYMNDFKQLDSGMRWKAQSCTGCIMNEICMGIWKEHAEQFLVAGIKPIA